MAEWVAAFPRTRWHRDGLETGDRALAEESAVAIVHDAATTAVLMATPRDLEDLAIGFSLTEGIVDTSDQIREIEVVATELGFEVRAWLTPDRSAQLAARRRRMAGPSGCGLCGIDSLEAALHPPRPVQSHLTLTADQLMEAMAMLPQAQALGHATRAVHAAAFWTPEAGLVAAREDVGRHNALDKLVGTLARLDVRGTEGTVLLTSRVSVEMVQKTAALGAGLLCAVSAPTALAVRTAEAAGLTLVAVARQDGFEVYTHPHRVVR